MADTREGEDGGLFRPEGKSNEKGGGSAPQIHPDRRPVVTSSSKVDVHPYALGIGEIDAIGKGEIKKITSITYMSGLEMHYKEEEGKPWLVTSSSKGGVHPDALKKREKGSVPQAPAGYRGNYKQLAKSASPSQFLDRKITSRATVPGNRIQLEEGSGPQIHPQGFSAIEAEEEEEEDLFDKISHSHDEVFIPPPKSLREHPDALKKEEEPSASNIEDKASEEGSATERHCETGEGISVIKSPPGDSGLTPEGDLVRLGRRKEQLIESLRKVNSGRTDVPEILDDSLLCLLYLSIFPENSEISCKRVSRLWAAEGLLTDLTKAEVFLSDLLDRKYIHRVKERTDGELSTFRLDDTVREIIASFSDLLGILKITNEGSKNSSERVRRLSVQGGIVTDEEKLSQLRSLFVFNVSSNKDETTKSQASLLGNSKNSLFPFNLEFLEVLDLTGAPLHTAPDSLFELTLLRYLSLRDTSIKKISGSIGWLTHLEFLDLKHSLVTELPKKVGGLKNICHVLIYHHEKDPLMESYNLIGFKALCSVGGLKRLEKLCFVESDDSILKDLGNLTKLTRLGITKLREEHGESLRSCLEKLERLESLNLHALDEDEIIDLYHLSSPPISLKRLYLHIRLNKLPNWISSLRRLTKIVLRWSHLETATQQEKDLLATLGELPELVELELRRAYNGRQLDFKNYQFPKLKILLLDELGRLRSMSLEEGTMPRLEDLTISRCQWLERIPTGIEHIIPTLKALEFFDMSREFYKMVPDDYRNSPKVYFTHWRPGQWKTIPLGINDCDECSAGEH